MSTQITTAFKNTYASNVEHIAQQQESRLRAFVRLDPGYTGEKKFIDQIGKADPQLVTDRHGDSPSRWSLLLDSEG